MKALTLQRPWVADAPTAVYWETRTRLIASELQHIVRMDRRPADEWEWQLLAVKAVDDDFERVIKDFRKVVSL